MSEQSKSVAAGPGRSKRVVERTYRARVEDLWRLWTTRQGFESWWGPVGFRAEVHTLEARAGGILYYDMIAEAPGQIAAMKQMGLLALAIERRQFPSPADQCPIAKG